MTFKCCVKGCNYEGTSGLHSFPSNEEAAFKWIRFSEAVKTIRLIKLLKTNKLSHSFFHICHKHFRPNDYAESNGDRRLLKGAIPTLFPPRTLLGIATEHHYAMSLSMQKKSRRIVDDNVNGTDSSNHNENSFFYFDDSMEVAANEDVFINTCSESSIDEENFKFEELNYYKEKCKELTSKVDELTQKLKENELTDDNVLKYLNGKFNKQQLEFFKMQIYNSGKGIHARRYSSDQKSLSMAMFKQSPKKYRFLKQMFILPSKSTLARHSAKFIFQSGKDLKLLSFISARVNNLSEVDKYCILSWDEVALKAHIDFNKSRDKIDGFVELNELRRPEFATHSLTFMVRGINTPFKQPVAFYYTAGLTAFELSELIEVTTGTLFDTGLKTIGSLCDQPSTCVAGVQSLIEQKFRKKTPNGSLLEYKIRDNNIVHMYDPPHLMKVLRNNLQTKDLEHSLCKRWEITDCKNLRSRKPKYASWDHISELYRLDCSATQRRLPKLTDEHINPNTEKMRVSVATQIFSKTVGDVMLHCIEKNQIPIEFADTAYALLFFNYLFDSLNGGGSPMVESLKGSITNESIHFAFWEYALTVLQNMNFVDKGTKKINNNSTLLKKMESTIRGYIEITRISLNAQMLEVPLRNSNQDGLENFFGCCKALCGTKPIASHYRSAYATMIMNNLIGSKSVGSNCEQDNFIPLLSDVHKMLADYKEETVEANGIRIVNKNIQDIFSNIVFDPLFGVNQPKSQENGPIPNGSNTVCQNLMQTTNCNDCKRNLQEPSVQLEEDELSIVFPSEAFNTHFENIFSLLNVVIPDICSETFLKTRLLSLIDSIQIDSIGCQDHWKEMAIKFKDLTATYSLMNFCKNINNILSGKITILPPEPNHMQEKALHFRQKRKRIGKYSDILHQ